MTLYRVKNNRLYYGTSTIPLLTSEVHIHLDGSLDALEVLNAANRLGQRLYLPVRDKHGNRLRWLRKRIRNEEQLTELWQGWDTYTIPEMFAPVTGIMQTKREIIELSKLHILKQAREGKVYVETRFAPQYHASDGVSRESKLSMDQAVGYVLEGLFEGAEIARLEGYRIIPRLIVCIGREAEPDLGVKVAQTALNFQNRGVVALDLACDEKPFPPERHREAFELTFDSSLKRTVHAGEQCDVAQNLRNIETALDVLRADGLGHAKDLYRDRKLIEKMLGIGIKRGYPVRIESNEVSNVAAGFARRVGDAHLERLVEYGILVIIDSDDPSMWPDGSLAHCLFKAAEVYGDYFVRKVIANPIRGAFGLDDEQKKSLIKTLEGQLVTRTTI